MGSSLIAIAKLQRALLSAETRNATYRSVRSVQLFMRSAPFYPTFKILCFAMG